MTDSAMTDGARPDVAPPPDTAWAPADSAASPVAIVPRTATGAVRSDELVGAEPRTRHGLVLLAVVGVLALAAFLYFWPVWTGQTLAYEAWRARMWLGSLWI